MLVVKSTLGVRRRSGTTERRGMAARRNGTFFLRGDLGMRGVMGFYDHGHEGDFLLTMLSTTEIAPAVRASRVSLVAMGRLRLGASRLACSEKK